MQSSGSRGLELGTPGLELPFFPLTFLTVVFESLFRKYTLLVGLQHYSLLLNAMTIQKP